MPTDLFGVYRKVRFATIDCNVSQSLAKCAICWLEQSPHLLLEFAEEPFANKTKLNQTKQRKYSYEGAFICYAEEPCSQLHPAHKCNIFGFNNCNMKNRKKNQTKLLTWLKIICLFLLNTTRSAKNHRIVKKAALFINNLYTEATEN